MIRTLLYRYKFYKAEKYENIFLPKFKNLNQNLNNNEDYINSAMIQISHLYEFLDVEKEYRFLDFGCGQGRIANGLIFGKYKISEYYGIDTVKSFITWCKNWISKFNSSYTFKHLNAKNSRYNNSANSLLSLPLKNNSIDIVFLNSVFSHMLADDVLFYLKEFYRVLVEGGTIYLTGFIEENVPDVEENPEDYIDESVGPLHRVRYSLNYFSSLVEEADLKIESFFHQKIQRTMQSVFILKKINA